MKVAVIIDTWFPFIGGGQISAFEIAKRIASKNFQIDIITRNNGKDFLPRVKFLNIVKLGKFSSPNDNLSKITFTIRAFLYIYRRDYDIIHAHAFHPGIIARILMVARGIPTIFTIHGTSIGTKLNGAVLQTMEKIILTKIAYSAQITVSQDFFKFKNVNKNILYIPNGILVNQFDKVSVKKNNKQTLIFVGRLHPQKNLMNLIRALALVKKSIIDIQLIIVGVGAEKEKIINEVKALKLKMHVKMMGHKFGNELIKLYKSSHIFILPSIYEGLPIALLEAWACKLPVIVTKAGDCQFIVNNGNNGYLIKNPNNVDEIASVIIKAFSKKNFESLGMNGYKFVKKETSWEIAASKTKELYERIINE